MSSTPNPCALFSLIPVSEHAKRATTHTRNRHLARVDPANGVYALDIGFHIKAQSRYLLATIGRVRTDVIVRGTLISKTQCAFQFVPETGCVMVYDKSSRWSTRFFGDNAQSFEPDRSPRRILIHPGVNEVLGFGGVNCDLVVFNIVWHKKKINIHHELELQSEESYFAPTPSGDDATTAAPSRVVTRIYTPSSQKPRFRWINNGMLGQGGFGFVLSALNVDTGAQMAVKKIRLPEAHEPIFLYLKREVTALKSLNHPNIVEFLHAQRSTDDTHLEIFTLQQAGDIRGLIHAKTFKDAAEAGSLLQQMLRALDYLDSKNLIHRDIKPGNILYTPDETGNRYQLNDFGLVNDVSKAVSFTGTPIYMAPESLEGPQSSKMDVWSLFVTLLEAVDVPSGFRAQMNRAMDPGTGKVAHQLAQLNEIVHAAAKLDFYRKLRHMAEPDPVKRASAGDMIDKLFAGVGRTTKRAVTPARPNHRAVPRSTTNNRNRIAKRPTRMTPPTQRSTRTLRQLREQSPRTAMLLD